MRNGLRWAVSLEETMTSSSFENVFRRAVLCSAEHDVEQQRRFRYKEDALACLIGRLMPRKAAAIQTSLPWREVQFERNETGKPFLSTPSTQNFEYNVSHQGDLVVMATAATGRIGVDVMRIDESRRTSAGEQMDALRRHFSREEVEEVKAKSSESERWRAFYRIWCLKESILKATGVGLPDGLHNHTFHVSRDEEHIPGCLITSTQYFHRGRLQPQWRFDESFIGTTHCVAVASESSSEEDVTPQHFEMTSLAAILNDDDDNDAVVEFLNPGGDVDDELDEFMAKPNKPF